MQKNKTTDWKNTRQGKELLKAIEDFIPMPHRQGMISGYISVLLSQERKQWERDLRKKIQELDPQFQVGVLSNTSRGIYYSKEIIISLLDSKEELPLIVNRKPFDKNKFIKLARKVKKILKEEGKL